MGVNCCLRPKMSVTSNAISEIALNLGHLNFIWATQVAFQKPNSFQTLSTSLTLIQSL